MARAIGIRRTVVELRRFLTKEQRKRPFRLRKASFKGNGLQPHLQHAAWDRLRALIYEGRGG